MQVITRRPGEDLTRVELTHLPRKPIDPVLAERQHGGYRAALEALGAQITDLPALAGHPDAVFVEDALIALPEVFVACAPGAPSRAGEVESLTAALPDDRPLIRLAPPATLDGGDVLRLGRNLHIGLSARSNGAAIEQLRAALAPYGYAVEAAAFTGALHLKTAVTAVNSETLLVNRAWVDTEQFGPRRIIEVGYREPFAANCLPFGGRVLVQSAHQNTADRLSEAGFRVTLIEVGELAKAEAGLTCMSVLVPPTE